MQVVRDDVRSGGLIYTFRCGHEFHFTAEANHAYIKENGPDAPKECPVCFPAPVLQASEVSS